MSNRIVNARGSYQLTDDNSLSTVDDKGTCRCHQRQFTHKDFVFLDFLSLFVVQTNLNL